MSKQFQDVFHPVEGAVLDLESLKAVSGAFERLQAANLSVQWPGVSGLVLEGLEIVGDWAHDGPPGTKRPEPSSKSVAVSPGRALVTGRNGRPYLIHLEQELKAKWPTSAGSAVEAVLVLVPKVEAESLEGDVLVARERISTLLGFVKPAQAEQPFLLPLAAALGNGRDWATDLRRIWQPEHEAVQILLKKFEKLEHAVWTAEPEGAVWDRQVLGRNWVRYQTVAASALQSARMLILAQSMTTLDRVRLLDGLYQQLERSVERAANELLQVLGPKEYEGPYSVIGPPSEDDKKKSKAKAKPKAKKKA
jgi:hypothetical protein